MSNSNIDTLCNYGKHRRQVAFTVSTDLVVSANKGWQIKRATSLWVNHLQNRVWNDCQSENQSRDSDHHCQRSEIEKSLQLSGRKEQSLGCISVSTVQGLLESRDRKRVPLCYMRMSIDISLWIGRGSNIEQVGFAWSKSTRQFWQRMQSQSTIQSDIDEYLRVTAWRMLLGSCSKSKLLRAAQAMAQINLQVICHWRPRCLGHFQCQQTPRV